MSVVVVHEWIEATGGSEAIVESFVSLLPDAHLYCLWNDSPERFADRDVTESPLARTPLRRSKALSIPFQPAVWRRVPGDYDLALVSSHAFAHHARFPESGPELRKFVYVHTPARYLWAPELDSRGAGLLGRIAGPPLRALDRRRSSTDDRQLAANSAFVAGRIGRAWHEDAAVIHPPVEVTRIQSTDWESLLTDAEHEVLAALPEHYVFSVGRLIGYKRFDKVIEFAAMTDTHVVLAGSGPLDEKLRGMAAELRAPVTFLGRVSDALMFVLHRRAQAFVFFGVEDFGITTVEALAVGTPVIACDEGGSTEIVTTSAVGALCDVDSTADLRSALDRVSGIDPETVRTHARRFSREVFAHNIKNWVGLEATSGRDVANSQRILSDAHRRPTDQSPADRPTKK